MTIDCKLSTQLSEKEMLDFCRSFEKTFEGHHKPVEEFKNEYFNSCLGYSFHILLKNDKDVIVGGYCAIPFYYNVKGERMIFAAGADFMIEKEYRNDFKNVFNIIKFTESFLKDNQVAFLYGLPNDLSYQLNMSLMRMKYISSLNTYILPIKIGDAKQSLRWLNPFSAFFSKLLLALSRFDCSTKIVNYPIEIDRTSLSKFRYKWFNPDNYYAYSDDNFSCYWVISEFEGIKACFLLDVYPFSNKYFNQSVRTMVDKMKNRVGLFLYVGFMNKTPISVIKVPAKIQPKKFRFVGKILDKRKLSEDFVLDIMNWNVNMANFDLL